jgi:hypothetical protein
MKKDWFVFAATIVLAAWGWHSQQKFFRYFNVEYKTTNAQKITWVERVLYAAALSNVEPPAKEKCPRAAKRSGHLI